MNYAARVFFSDLRDSQTESPSVTIAKPAVGNGQRQADSPVRERLQPLTDEQREAAIVRAGKLVEHYMAKWEATGDFQYRGDADRALRFMEILIKGRSPEQVARMERERGLA